MNVQLKQDNVYESKLFRLMEVIVFHNGIWNSIWNGIWKLQFSITKTLTKTHIKMKEDSFITL